MRQFRLSSNRSCGRRIVTDETLGSLVRVLVFVFLICASGWAAFGPDRHVALDKLFQRHASSAGMAGRAHRPDVQPYSRSHEN